MQSFSIADANILVREVSGCQELSNGVRRSCWNVFDAKVCLGRVASFDKRLSRAVQAAPRVAFLEGLRTMSIEPIRILDHGCGGG
jgi:hypothetical protein